jgi:hypothetical protein
MYHVNSMRAGNILMCVCEVQYTILGWWFTIDYLLMLFVGGGLKCRPRRIIQGHVRLQSIPERAREVNITKA